MNARLHTFAEFTGKSRKVVASALAGRSLCSINGHQLHEPWLIEDAQILHSQEDSLLDVLDITVWIGHGMVGIQLNPGNFFDTID